MTHRLASDISLELPVVLCRAIPSAAVGYPVAPDFWKPQVSTGDARGDCMTWEVPGQLGWRVVGVRWEACARGRQLEQRMHASHARR